MVVVTITEHRYRIAEVARRTGFSTPTLMLQGRHDFLFDIDQAETAYRQLAGPKELYLGDLGHVPAPSPAAEQSTYLGLAVKWFDKYLKGSGSAGARSNTVISLAATVTAAGSTSTPPAHKALIDAAFAAGDASFANRLHRFGRPTSR